jgi:addiction module RelB/DinJ family antitoxin
MMANDWIIMKDTLTIRIDHDLKESFTEVVESLGLDAPTAVRMFAKQTVQTHALPLTLSAKALAEKDTLGFLDSVRADWGEW